MECISIHLQWSPTIPKRLHHTRLATKQKQNSTGAQTILDHQRWHGNDGLHTNERYMNSHTQRTIEASTGAAGQQQHGIEKMRSLSCKSTYRINMSTDIGRL